MTPLTLTEAGDLFLEMRDDLTEFLVEVSLALRALEHAEEEKAPLFPLVEQERLSQAVGPLLQRLNVGVADLNEGPLKPSTWVPRLVPTERSDDDQQPN